MIGKLRSLKTIAIIIWGILISLIIFNQRIDLNYLQKERWSSVQDTAYLFSEDGNDKENITKYRIVNGNGWVLYGFSEPEDFVSFLKFNFQKPQTIRFNSRFQRTDNCTTNSIPDDAGLLVSVNGTVFNLQTFEDKANELRLKVSADDQIIIRAQTSQPDITCGALQVEMSQLETGGWEHFLLINSIWAVFIVLMLLYGRYFLPVFAGLLFYTFQQAELLYNTILSWQQLLMFSAMSMGVTLSYSLITSLGRKNVLQRFFAWGISCLIMISALFSPAIVLGFNVMFEGPMSKYDWFAILQTDLNEVVEFIGVFAPNILLVQSTIVVFLLLVMLVYSSKKRPRYPILQWLTIVLAAIIVAGYHDTSSVFAKSFGAITEYYEDLARLEEQAKERQNRLDKIRADKVQTDEIYVVIIGESANRNHFSLYGYPRATTPRLDKRYHNNDLIRFDQSYSCGVSTRGALQYALTEATLKKGSPSESPSVMEILNGANIETYWIHNGSTTIRNNLLNLIGEQAQYTDHLSSIYGLEDGKLITEVEKVLAKDSTSSKVIFLKTQGSHLEYCQRLPEGDEWVFADKNFDRWLIPDKYVLTNVSAGSNCYDGSIKYTDFVIDEVIARVEQTGKVGAVIYLSDHGEEIVEGTAHMGKPPTYGVFAVPMAIWLSKSYQQRYQDKHKNVATNARKVFVNDVLFDSMLGLMNVNYNGITGDNDISSSQYKNGKYVFRGKKTVYDADNYLFHTPQNIQKLAQQNHPYPIFLGPVEHPFHLAWLTGERRYDNLAFATTYENGRYNVDSTYYKQPPVALETVFNYLHPQPSQTYFIRINFPPDIDNDLKDGVENFLSLLETTQIDSAKVVVTSRNQSFLEALKLYGISVSYWLNDEDLMGKKYQHEAMSIDLDQISSLDESIANRPVNIWISSCNINNCDERVFERLNELSDKVNVERVILPMFDI